MLLVLLGVGLTRMIDGRGASELVAQPTYRAASTRTTPARIPPRQPAMTVSFTRTGEIVRPASVTAHVIDTQTGDELVRIGSIGTIRADSTATTGPGTGTTGTTSIGTSTTGSPTTSTSPPTTQATTTTTTAATTTTTTQATTTTTEATTTTSTTTTSTATTTTAPAPPPPPP